MPAATLSEPESVHFPAPTPGEQTSSTSDSDHSSAFRPTPDKESRRPKQPMKEFVRGGDLIRKTLPICTLPHWLDPRWVDVDVPTRLPLCWYGVPFVPKLVYAYAERMGLASYYTQEVLRSKPGDLDPFQTWANLEVWFQKESGIKLDLNLVWGEAGEPDNVLTFWSNHEVEHITRAMWGQACDLLDDMDYGEEYEMMWYLDRNLAY